MHAWTQSETLKRRAAVPRWLGPRFVSEARHAGRQQLSQIENKSEYIAFSKALPRLNSWLTETRLVTLHEGREDDPIHCSIEKTSLHKDINYDALSYTWESHEPEDKSHLSIDTHIHVDGLSIAVLPNLYRALRRIRYVDISRRLWIDYLCIDQTSAKERSVQVAIMDKIFFSAQETICFLGDEGSDTALALQLQEALACRWMKDDQHLPKLQEEFPPQAFRALQQLWERPWFFRIWTVQEVRLGRGAVLVCGNHETSWSAVTNAAMHLCNHRNCCDEDESLKRLVAVGPRMLGRHPGLGLTNGLTLTNLLYSYGYCRATDPRDYIFGLLGMLSPEKRLIMPDYTLTAVEVFRKAAIAIMKSESTIDFLTCFSAILERPRPDLNLPSWVIKFDDGHFDDLRRSSVADYSSCARYKAPRFAEINASTITYSGFVFDTVSQIAKPYPKRDMQDEFITLGDVRLMISHIQDLGSTAAQWRHMMDAQTEDETSRYTPRGIYPSNAVVSALYRSLTRGTFQKADNDGNETKSDACLLLEQLRHTLETNVSSSTQDDGSTEIWNSIIGQNAEGPQVRALLSVLRLSFTHQCLYYTEGGLIGIAPRDTCTGDKITIFEGGSVPFLLREKGRMAETKHQGKGGEAATTYRIQGLTYVDGIMHGEAVSGEVPWKPIHLV